MDAWRDHHRRLGRLGSALLWLFAALAIALASPPASAQVDGLIGGQAQPGPAESTSFASAFFISRVTHPNGERTIDLFGSALLWLLLLLSMLSIGLIGTMALTNQRKSIVPPGVVQEIHRLIGAGRYKDTIDLAARDRSFFGQIMHAALKESSHGFAAVVRSLEQTSSELTTIRLRRIEYLNILGQVAPMIGLFGTVWGMILAFNAIVMSGGNADPVLLAGGIGTALTTTFWGLLIAIPALSAYAIIRNKIDELTTEATIRAQAMLNEFRPAPKPAAAPARPAPVAAV